MNREKLNGINFREEHYSIIFPKFNQRNPKFNKEDYDCII